ncbi:MAG: DUF3850 domain-containing protein [Coriobacteriales bacterium]|jgi:hypothetical protein|nr:DUF3850 domain-containing protein [Coriobacteriales bacterium]
MLHELRTAKRFFDLTWAGFKTDEVRWDDRDYRPGDRVRMSRDGYLWGPVIEAEVASVTQLDDVGCPPGWVLLGLRIVKRDDRGIPLVPFMDEDRRPQ